MPSDNIGVRLAVDTRGLEKEFERLKGMRVMVSWPEPDWDCWGVVAGQFVDRLMIWLSEGDGDEEPVIA